jgi:hypothetical protein
VRLPDWLKNTALGNKFISEEHCDLLRVFDKSEEVVDAVKTWYWRQEIVARRPYRDNPAPRVIYSTLPPSFIVVLAQ